jgi:uncharacterized membrane protein YfcA
MYTEIVTLLLGVFIGLYAAFAGTPGGSAIAIYILVSLGIVASPTEMAGTILYISSVPIGLAGVYMYYKKKQVDFYIGTIMIIGMLFGIYYGSKYGLMVNKIWGEKYGNFLKYSVTAVIFTILSVLYSMKSYQYYIMEEK